MKSSHNFQIFLHFFLTFKDPGNHLIIFKVASHDRLLPNFQVHKEKYCIYLISVLYGFSPQGGMMCVFLFLGSEGFLNPSLVKEVKDCADFAICTSEILPICLSVCYAYNIPIKYLH